MRTDSELSIERIDSDSVSILRPLAIKTFLEAHAHSASDQDISAYVDATYSKKKLIRELDDPDNHIHVLYLEDTIVGYVMAVLNSPEPHIEAADVCKLERIYVLEEYHDMGLGARLLDFVHVLARKNKQKGIWLHTWIENHRAIRFYQRKGFAIVGSFDFVISETHVNPNHVMWWEF